MTVFKSTAAPSGAAFQTASSAACTWAKFPFTFCKATRRGSPVWSLSVLPTLIGCVFAIVFKA
ncbi:hypothetical protein DDE05_18725 [Streptomyces cavourensis]|nr:hypothetical protein DDE05_18725 [Streptomyces cavourensis]